MPEVKALVVLDGEGARIAAKYFSKTEFGDKTLQADLERKMFRKLKAAGGRGDTEVALVEGYTTAFRTSGDVSFWVLGGGDENELILVAVVEALSDAVSALLRHTVDKRSLLTNLELLLLAMDELVDGGVILELDPASIEARVMLKGAVPESISGYKEMTIGSAIERIKDRAGKLAAAGGKA